MINKYTALFPLVSLLPALFQDRNDIPPVFTTVPHPVTLNDDVPIGTTVTTLIATDSDGTSPGNKVYATFLRMCDTNHPVTMYIGISIFFSSCDCKPL
jgi:hypothetical protein